MQARSGLTPSRLVAVAVAALSIALAGPAVDARAGERDTAASAFAVRTVRLLVANRYSAAWASLHPSHQRAIGGRDTYVRCELSAPVAGSAMAIEGLEVRDEVAPIAGIGRVPTKAVGVRITFAGSAQPGSTSVTLSVHVLLVGGSWRWVLPNARYANYRRGACG